MEETRETYTLSTDPAAHDVAQIHAWLTRSYWAEGIPLETVARSLAHSLCFGIRQGDVQAAFARVVTDRATFAYLCDVFVIEDHRGRGLSTWLLEAITRHSDLQGVRRFLLVTRDAHGLYEKFGFAPPAKPRGFLEINRRASYAPAPPGPAAADLR